MIGLNKIGLNQVQLNRLRLNAPFPTCRKMAGGGGSSDGFPQLPGDVTRWYFGGLTNEMMAAMDDPRIEDADHKGRFLSFKNFAWSGMSGVGGYVENYNRWTKSAVRADITFTGHSFNVTSVKINQAQFYYQSSGGEQPFTVPSGTVIVKGLTDGQVLEYIYTDIEGRHVFTVKNDGIYTLPSFEFIAKGAYYGFQFNKVQESCNITIEQLPLYPGFILGDGVDDFAVTEKELNFEDTYTVYTAFIPFQNDPARNMTLCGKNDTKDFSINYSGTHLNFKPSTGVNLAVRIDQFALLVCKRNKDITTIINLSTGESRSLKSVEFISNPGLYYLWRNVFATFYAKAAIAGQIIDNGHFTTDEEDENILNWHKKQYPWLFPDQAWTVTGKTNEDEDRATIANITGNGNDLVLSNLGFAEGSGYGLYKLNFNNWFANSGSGNVNIVNVVNPHKIVLEQSQEAVGAFFLGKNVSYSGELKISISNKPSDIELSFGSTALGKVILNEGINIVKINPVNTSIGFFTNKAFEAQNIIIEQIPEYKGYLLTDGVDDKAVSKQFKFGENFTVILDFKFPVKKISYCGFDLSSKVRIQNLQGSGVNVVLKGNKTLIPSNVVRAVTSEGKVYDENWNEYNIVPGNISSNYTMVNLGFDGSNQFAESATKLAGIYSSTLSKDDCIKAYNYLQTLKAK